jgi:4'-phosphopantetheinyl transferase
MASYGWPPLSLRHAGLWWLTVDDVPTDTWLRLLDDDERERAGRFVHERDRRPFIAAHALLRILLQRLAGRPADAWRFVSSPRGKPSLHPEHGLSRLAFNLSHAKGAVACAVTVDHPIGVDIEQIERTVKLLELADAHFAASERALLRAAPAGEQRPLFFRLWTLKEAYIKAHGDGLAPPLDQFAFTTAPPAIGFAPEIRDDPAAWQFETLTPTPDHILSLAIRRGGTPVAVAPFRVTHSGIDRLMAAAARG